MRRIRRLAFVLISTLMVLVMGNSHAFAAYGYVAQDPENLLGVKFYAVIQYDPVSKHVRAQGIIDATGTGYAGRILYLRLDRKSPVTGEWTQEALDNTPVATYGYDNSTIAGPVICAKTAYRAVMKVHVDGTTQTDYAEPYTGTLSCS